MILSVIQVHIFVGFGLYCNAILHAMCFQFCLHRDIHKKCIPTLIQAAFSPYFICNFCIDI